MGRKDEPLDAYRRVRKPMPPPERVERDRRRKLREERERREALEELLDGGADRREDRSGEP